MSAEQPFDCAEFDLVPEGGQQGFPSLSGNRLVWQDAAFGGDDVLTTELPDDL